MRLGEIIPWQDFRVVLEQVQEKVRKSKAGRKPIDVLLLFKLLILQQSYHISDESLAYQVNDRLSFMRFLNLGIEDQGPDANRFAQKDTDARWTQKNGASHFGYKDHVSIDTKYRFIRRYAVTDAAVHDSKMLGAVLDDENSSDQLWADRFNRSAAIEAVLKLLQFDSVFHERAYRNHPLTEDQKESICLWRGEALREKSKTRSKVEHVFGNWVTTMGG